MLDNAPVKSIHHKGLTVEGYSRAAVQSYWRIPELRMGFDLGAHPWDFMGTATWMISHTHLDHIAALPSYVARRRMMKMEPPTIYLPEYAVENVKAVLSAFTRLDRGRLPCDLIGVIPGDEIDFSRELTIEVIKTRHTIPSVGYIVFERRFKLKKQYLGLSGDEIRKLRESGTEITVEQKKPLVGFVGDSTPEVFDDYPELYKARILITELTFVDPQHRKELIHKNGHMHIDDYVARADKFENEVIVAGHFSTRYNSRQAKRMVEKRLPGLLDGRLHVWLD